MKIQFSLLCLIVIIGTNSCGQQTIKKLINDNLKSRYTNVEIVSITQDSCPDMDYLFNLSLSLKLVASECKLNISKTILKYSQNEINFDKTSELCQKEIDRIDALAKSWQKAYLSKTEKCLLVQYRYGSSNGIKTTVNEYYSLDEKKYKEGNYPYLLKEFDINYGFNFYKDVIKMYQDFLLEIANG
jgi:hypothetical protein